MKFALIGEKLGHSYSKIIHDKYFKYKGLKCTYDLVEIPKGELNNKLSLMKESGYFGFNVTIPYKIDVMSMCDEVSKEARKIKSVNTVKFSDDKMQGFNTDYHGLKLALSVNGIELKNKSVVILGTGGASKAVSALASDLGCHSITYVSRTAKNDLDYKCITYDDLICGDVIINTTPVGMYPNTEISPLSSFVSFETAVDLIYNPNETLFLKSAKDNGLKTVNGLYMLVAQALYSQSIWHDNEPDTELIDKIYNEMRGF